LMSHLKSNLGALFEAWKVNESTKSVKGRPAASEKVQEYQKEQAARNLDIAMGALSERERLAFEAKLKYKKDGLAGMTLKEGLEILASFAPTLGFLYAVVRVVPLLPGSGASSGHLSADAQQKLAIQRRREAHAQAHAQARQQESDTAVQYNYTDRGIGDEVDLSNIS